MEKKINLFFVCMLLILTAGCGTPTDIFAPDSLYPDVASEGILATNRSGCELLLLSPDLQTIQRKVSFPSPVNKLTHQGKEKIWLVTDGLKGELYELDAANLSVLSHAEAGHTPSAVHYNRQTQSLWITSRFHNEVREMDPATKEIKNRIPVGREPVDVVSFAGDSLLLIVNNLPAMQSLAYPIATQVDVVDVYAKKLLHTIFLPNGSTDAKAVVVDKEGSYAYVTHLLSRYQLPTHQVDRGWMCTNALSIIDLKSKEWLTTVLLDTPQKGAANPWGVEVTPDDRQIVIALSGSHELAVIDRLALHQRLDAAKEGIQVTPSTKNWDMIPNDTGFLYGIREFIPTSGKSPRTVVFKGDHIYTANYYTGEIIRLDRSFNSKETISYGSNLVSTDTGLGEMYFHDATLSFQSWQSCASCHPNDARIDGLNWDLMNDGLGNPKNTKSLLYSHVTPPSMITGIRKDAETAVRSGIRYILFAKENEAIAQAMDKWLKSLRPLPSPWLENGELSAAAKRGKAGFDRYCAACHSGSYYTDGKQYYISWAEAAEKEVKMDVPALNEVWRTAPYLYDGRAYTMREMLNIHGPETPLADGDLNDLAQYVLSL